MKSAWVDLQLVNHGEGVVFYTTIYSMDDNENSYLECDRSINAAGGALLVNYVKTSPTEMDIGYVQFEALRLNLILKYPLLFKRIPHSALEELNEAKLVFRLSAGATFALKFATNSVSMPSRPMLVTVTALSGFISFKVRDFQCSRNTSRKLLKQEQP